MPANTNTAVSDVAAASYRLLAGSLVQPATHSLRDPPRYGRAFGSQPDSAHPEAYASALGRLGWVPGHLKGGCEPGYCCSIMLKSDFDNLSSVGAGTSSSAAKQLPKPQRTVLAVQYEEGEHLVLVASPVAPVSG